MQFRMQDEMKSPLKLVMLGLQVKSAFDISKLYFLLVNPIMVIESKS